MHFDPMTQVNTGWSLGESQTLYRERWYPTLTRLMGMTRIAASAQTSENTTTRLRI